MLVSNHPLSPGSRVAAGGGGKPTNGTRMIMSSSQLDTKRNSPMLLKGTSATFQAPHLLGSSSEYSTSTPCQYASDDKSADSLSSSLHIPGTEKGGRQLAIVFTCNICQTRSVKAFTEQAYNNGVVLARCPGCQNLHLIADRLGYFDDQPLDIEKIAEQTGQSVKKITNSDVTELSLEDLLGKEKAEQLYNEINEKTKDS